MRKTSIFILAALIALPGIAATNSGTRSGSTANLTDGPDSKSTAVKKTEYKKYTTKSTQRTYAVKDSGNKLYYTEPDKRSPVYEGFSGCNDDNGCDSVKSARADMTRRENARKYYLSNPFFQPMQGKFGSITNIAYNFGGFDFNMGANANAELNDRGGNWSYNSISVDEDLSVGITDTLSVMGKLRWSSKNYEYGWDNDISKWPSEFNTSKQHDQGFDVLGLGLQWRFVNDTDWIGYVGGHYHRYIDIADVFMADAKVGYKIANSTVYGLGRFYYFSFEADNAGWAVEDNTNGSIAVISDYETSGTTYGEVGLGLFSVLAPDWTLNLEGTVGDYHWHSAGAILAELGWQPGQSFSLNIWGKMSVFDSVNGKKMDLWAWDAITPTPALAGQAKLDNYSDVSVGVRAILYF
ncbi:MAG: hypothetical protein LBO08_02435 [Rickettsiales bacterium]|nr:hypothetical protein [Rickettsiales bacterium]